MPSAANLLRARPAPYSSGRGLFVTETVQPGQLVLHVPAPLVAVPDDRHLASCCSWCMRQAGSAEDARLVRCAGCRVVWYCGKECQKRDFVPRHALPGGIHKLECPIYAGLRAGPQRRVLPASVRVLVKLLLLHSHSQQQQHCPQGEGAPAWWAALQQLEAHTAAQLAQPQRGAMLPAMAAAAQHYAREHAHAHAADGVLALYCRTLVNSFSVTAHARPAEPLGSLLDPLLALFNHSCAPSCALECRGREVAVYALRELPAGAEATVAYLDVDAVSVQERRRVLRERWFFDCMCARCRREMGEKEEEGEGGEGGGEGQGEGEVDKSDDKEGAEER
ncbi:hypothetical protein EV426DRAFT_715621 [Tirmania nivea]|nr:hypothetical protein EV426DRAFT_715621 [Tirmania nivea]